MIYKNSQKQRNSIQYPSALDILNQNEAQAVNIDGLTALADTFLGKYLTLNNQINVIFSLYFLYKINFF
jgi:hypothetical protein